MTESIEPAQDDSHRQLPVQEIVQLLKEHLGEQLLAITVNVRPATLVSWERGELHPQASAERRLRATYEVWQLVVSVESSETTRAWWMGMKDQLGDQSPAEALAAGEEHAVMSVARDFVESG